MINHYFSTAEELSIVEIITNLSWEPLTKRREAHVVSLVKKKNYASKMVCLVISGITLNYANLNYQATTQEEV